MLQKIEEIESFRARLVKGGGDKAIEKQHAAGKLTARERIEYLFDHGTFNEFDVFAKQLGRHYGLDKAEVPADGVVTGYGKINGRDAFVYSEDFTVIAGTFGEMHGRKVGKVIELAMKMGKPVIGINDSGGARVTEEMGALSQYGQLFFRHVRASGLVPQISLVMGPVAGGQAYSPALMDFIFMVENSSYMFIAGPPLVKAIVFEEVNEEQLGGPKMHATVSGVSDLTTADDKDCLERTKELLSYLPLNSGEMPPYVDTGDSPDRTSDALLEMIPTNPNKMYDVHKVIKEIVDNGQTFEIKKEFARNLVCCFARMNGHVVGIVANNPIYMAGALDYKASQKGARFIRFCNAFNIPLITLQDVPAFLIGTKSERDGIIRHGSKMLYAYAEANVPKLTVVLRKAYAGGYLAMCSKDLGADFVFELPTGEICLMGPEGAVNILFRKEIAASADPEATRRQYLDEFQEKFVNPTYSAGLQHVDDIIDPRKMRPKLIRALEVSMNKVDPLPKKKYGNMPI
ncbi:MAG: acyl-CoA carboxylase subunit beta [Actinobacteria bacterium]|nr:acyl-CoA carboxylase subunit beta [Actinomycetota bacterium]